MNIYQTFWLRTCNFSSRSGQAFIELMAGLVVIMVLLSGFVLVAELFETHNQTMVSAQLSAAEAAMAEEYSPLLPPVYLSGWGAGADQSRYTRDDVPLWVSNPNLHINRIASYADPEAIAGLIPGNPLSSIATDEDAAMEFMLVSGSSMRTVPTLPVVRQLFYNKSGISVRTQIWMTWLRGLY